MVRGIGATIAPTTELDKARANLRELERWGPTIEAKYNAAQDAYLDAEQELNRYKARLAKRRARLAELEHAE